MDGLSSIMEQPVAESKEPIRLLDDEARLLSVQEEIKVLINKDPTSGRPTSFEDVLQMMEKPDF
mgnify:CR=1 FL=1